MKNKLENILANQQTNHADEAMKKYFAKRNKNNEDDKQENKGEETVSTETSENEDKIEVTVKPKPKSTSKPKGENDKPSVRLNLNDLKNKQNKEVDNASEFEVQTENVEDKTEEPKIEVKVKPVKNPKHKNKSEKPSVRLNLNDLKNKQNKEEVDTSDVEEKTNSVEENKEEEPSIEVEVNPVENPKHKEQSDLPAKKATIKELTKKEDKEEDKKEEDRKDEPDTSSEDEEEERVNVKAVPNPVKRNTDTETTNSGINVPKEDLPKKKRLKLNGTVVSKNSDKETETVPVSNPNTNTTTSNSVQSTIDTDHQSSDNQNNDDKVGDNMKTGSIFSKLFAKGDKFEFQIQKVIRYTSIAFLSMFALLLFISIKTNSEIKSDNVEKSPNIIQNITDSLNLNIFNIEVPEFDVSSEPKALEGVFSSFNKEEDQLLKEKAVNQKKPANFFIIEEEHNNALQENTKFKMYQSNDSIVILESLLIELNPNKTSTFKHNGKEYDENAALSTWAIITPNSKVARKVLDKKEEIAIAIETAFYHKLPSELENKEANEQVVLFAVQRLIKEEVSVERVEITK